MFSVKWVQNSYRNLTENFVNSAKHDNVPVVMSVCCIALSGPVCPGEGELHPGVQAAGPGHAAARAGVSAVRDGTLAQPPARGEYPYAGVALLSVGKDGK